MPPILKNKFRRVDAGGTWDEQSAIDRLSGPRLQNNLNISVRAMEPTNNVCKALDPFNDIPCV